MMKELSLLFGIVLIVSYLAFAFVNWDIVWVAHVDMIARWFFVLLFVAFCLMFSAVYLDSKDK
ncbi:hypothetical protein ABVC73_05740 [Prevotella melaninogenica]